MLFIAPNDGPTLNAEQAATLDDEFFTARPLNYFSSRIKSLLEASERRRPSAATGHFLDALQLSPEQNPLEPTDSDRTLQVAVDALSARHHIAEALVRLLHALTEPSDEAQPRSVWAALADGPTGLHAVVTQVSARFDVAPETFAELFLPREPKDDGTRLAFDVAVSWVRRAMHLVTSNDLTVNAGYNKVKHGLAVRVRDDVRVEFLPVSDVKIGENGAVLLSSFDGSVPIIDKPEIAYLVRPFAVPKQGLEVDSLLLDAPVILAETWMMTVVYGALFHNAAERHFDGRDEEIAPYPNLPTGPTSAQLLDGRVQGFREVITSPPDVATTPRDSGIFHGSAFTPMNIDYGSSRTATILEG